MVRDVIMKVLSTCSIIPYTSKCLEASVAGYSAWWLHGGTKQNSIIQG